MHAKCNEENSSQWKPSPNTRVEPRQYIILPEQWYYSNLHNNSTEQIHKSKKKDQDPNLPQP